MPLYEFYCEHCLVGFEEIIKSDDANPICFQCSAPANRLISFPKGYKIMGDNSSSNSPKRFNNSEDRRKDGKRERVTNMIKRQSENL